MTENLDGWAKNVQVVKDQWRDYRVEVREVIIPGVKQAFSERKPGRILHKLHAFVEEWFDKQPRINSYLFWPALIALLYSLL